MGKIIDISGKTFGYLTALYPTRVKGRFGWHCKCQCGNEIDVDSNNLRTGKTKSCGCKRNELISKKVQKNLTNQRFGKLIALQSIKNTPSGYLWLCQCDCGNTTEVLIGNLTSGHTQSCGCLHKEAMHSLHLNLIGQRFGKLVVIEELPSENNESIWKCQCDCGNVVERIGWHLVRDKEGCASCGCVLSKGEEKIASILRNNNITFEQQKTFQDCRSPNNYLLRFDFFVDNKYIIEFDGIQHFQECGWNDSENFKKVKQYDEIKNQYCKKHDIPLIRIPYYNLSTLTLNDLLLKGE